MNFYRSVALVMAGGAVGTTVGAIHSLNECNEESYHDTICQIFVPIVSTALGFSIGMLGQIILNEIYD